MTQLQEVLFKLEGDYLGHPYHVTGNAIQTALARRLDSDRAGALAVSHGVFVPGETGSFPDDHSRAGGVPYFGTGLRPVETYDDLFLFRDPAQRWLSTTRPRPAHNTHQLREFGGRTAYAATRSFGRPPEKRKSKRTMAWYIHCYLTGPDALLPIENATLDGLCVGGGRNLGFGRTTLEETRLIDLSTLDYSRLREADQHVLELVSPYVLTSEAPGADDQKVPWWWDASIEDLRRRTTKLVHGDDEYTLETVDHGQVVGYTGDRPVETAKSGLRRVGTHAKFGFGELRVRPAHDDRVPARAKATERGNQA